MENRTKNGVRNILSSIPNRILQILLPFLIRTTMVKTIGSEYLGLSGLFTSILTVLNLAEFGFGSALVYSMYKPIADGDKGKINALLAVYRKVFMVIGAVVLLVGLCISPMLRFIIKDDAPVDVNVYILYFIYLLNTSVSYIFLAHRRALVTAYQRNDVINNINSACMIALYTLQITVLILVKNYYVYIILMPIFTIIENLWIALQSKKMLPSVICRGNISKSNWRQIKDHIKGLAIQRLCSASRNSFDSIVISMYLGLKSIAIYNNYYYIITGVHGALYQIPNSIRASMGNSIASESVDNNFKKFHVLTLIYQWVSAWCLAFLICLYQPFMKLWMGADMMVPFTTVVLFAIYFFELCMSDIIALFKDGAGLWWQGRYRTIIEAIANLILNFVLGKYFGMNGIIIATVITMALIGHIYGGYIVFHYYFVGKSYFQYIMSQITYAIIAFTGSALTYLVCYFVPFSGIVDLLCRFAICLIVPNIILIPLYKRNKYFDDAILLVKQMKGTIKK